MADNSESSFRIVIVGAGIAGLAAAIALRAPSRDIIILERSRLNRETGALISLQPNATKIISKWNIDHFLNRAEPVIDRAFRIFDIDGKLHAEIPLSKETFGANRIIYHRQDLHSALKEAAQSEDFVGPPARTRTSCEVVSCDCDEGVVVLESGERVYGDLIVGADGIHSVLRRFVTGNESSTIPTGLSAYRLLIDQTLLQNLQLPREVFDPSKPATTMIIGHDKRIVMGPGRGNKLVGIVAIVPDEQIHEDSSNSSWTSAGSVDKLIQSFADFPQWLQDILRMDPNVALWQLRDIDPLKTWTRSRCILIGDSSHAMLPTQGQGASQSVEDAEALQAFFSDVMQRPSRDEVEKRLAKAFAARYARASLIQQYSREQGRPGTDGATKSIRLNPGQFMKYNCNYDGVAEWLQAQTAQSKEIS
ncbi:MAG: hypothetical protein M1821_009093 [Bathelium mastoideum]|nr:MAG: hypothetical protein M1821_009093 [Bathelium mastoideum]